MRRDDQAGTREGRTGRRERKDRDRPRQELVLRDERVETRAEPLAYERRHSRDVDERLEQRTSLVQQDDLADTDAVVADALELARDREHGDDETQIRRDRLLRRD